MRRRTPEAMPATAGVVSVQQLRVQGEQRFAEKVGQTSSSLCSIAC